MIYRVFFVISVLVLSTFLFRRASGTLKLSKLNIISYIFYLFILQTFIGASLVYLGFREHYLIKKVTDLHTLDKTYYIICFTAIVLPLVMLLVYKITKTNISEKYDDYLNHKIILNNKDNIFFVTLLISVICIIFTVILFVRMGSVPLIDLILNKVNLLGKRRINISNATYINPYIKNLIVLAITPVLSYLSYIYYIYTKEKKWRYLFIILFITSIFIKTYNYAKTPIVFYLFTFVLLTIIIRGKIKIRKLIPVFILCGAIIVYMYLKIGYDFNKGIDIYNGPIGRTIFTQVGTLFLHVDLFPNHIGYLAGRSFSPTILKMFYNGIEHFRSGAVVMKFYSPEKVVEGIAGVMNSVFIGEAYANWGLKGVVFSNIYIGALLSLIFSFFTRIRKTPINITIYMVILTTLAASSQGGFTDFVYNSEIIVVTTVLLFIQIISKYVDKIKILNSIKKCFFNIKLKKEEKNE